jgi:adenylate cyclase
MEHRIEPSEPELSDSTMTSGIDVGPALDWYQARQSSGTEAPADLPEGDQHLNVDRTFVFADLTGFTRYTRAHGPHESVKLLTEFRDVTRSVAAKRGVRVAKWLGDGVMIVSVDPTAAIAFGAHLIHHFSKTDLDVRVGLASGIALLFEGDDYIGEPVNLASKLCAAANAGEILAATRIENLPDWVKADDELSVEIRGVGVLGDIYRLVPTV